MNRLALPSGVQESVGLEQFKPKNHPGPHHSPIVVALAGASGPEIHVFGGFTKLEASAVQIAAGIAAGAIDSEAGLRDIPGWANCIECVFEPPTAIAEAAVRIAAAVLKECDNYLKSQEEQKQ